MKVCVCGGTNPGTDAEFLDSVKYLAKEFCSNDIEIVWGGNPHGVLGVLYDEYVAQDKSHTLYIPLCYAKDLNEMEIDKVVVTDTIFERSDKMFKNSDCAVFLPGGIGTIYEFWTFVEGKRAGEYNSEIILYNYNNFYKDQLNFFNFVNKHGFTKTGVGGAPYKMQPTDLFHVANTAEEVMALVLASQKSEDEPKTEQK